MYKVLCDGTTICDSRVEELALIEPVVELEENKAGSFTFKMHKNHPYIDLIQRRRSVIEVWDDDELIFYGSCIECNKDFYNTKKYYCEGALAWLNDTIQRPKQYKDATVRGLLEAFIFEHNFFVTEEYRKFQVGVVTVTDSNDSLNCYTNMESTMQCIKEDLIDDLGGFIRVRVEDGIKYIDYLADYVNTNSQIIRFGKNLLDLSVNIDAADIATCIIPLGAKLEESAIEGIETRLDIKSVNNGNDFVYSEEAINSFGWIYKTVIWDDVTTPETLKAKGEKYLADIQFENMVIEAKAVDMHIVEGSVESFKLSDKIPVISEPHGLKRDFPLTKQKIYLNAREKNTVRLGKTERASFTAKSSAANAEIKKKVDTLPTKSSLLQEAQTNASNLIKMATNGYIILHMNDAGVPDEIIISDRLDYESTEARVWRWNVNGLAYSSTGYNGDFGKVAITMNGEIVADFITVGAMQADRIHGGTLKLGGSGNGNGVAQILDEAGNILIILDKDGIKLADNVKLQIGAKGTANDNYMYLIGYIDNVLHSTHLEAGVVSVYDQDGVSATMTKEEFSMQRNDFTCLYITSQEDGSVIFSSAKKFSFTKDIEVAGDVKIKDALLGQLGWPQISLNNVLMQLFKNGIIEYKGYE